MQRGVRAWQPVRSLNYRHAFHVGNFGDVVKHTVLLAVLRHMHRKDKAMLLMDTHASRGIFDMTSPEAVRSPEHLHGVAKLMHAASGVAPQAVQEYVACLRAVNAGQGAVRYYPGSPMLFGMRLRQTDRLVLSELHEAEADALRAHLRRFCADLDAERTRGEGSIVSSSSQCRVVQGDGFDTWLSFVPPAERRGLILCDPPYEKTEERARVLETLRLAHRRWGSGTCVIWFPIKDLPGLHEFKDSVRALGIPKILAATVLVRDASLAPHKLNGCGLLIVNPPFTLDAELADCIPWLARVLADDDDSPQQGGQAGSVWANRECTGSEVFWLTPDSHGPK
jgi:23S rRNA (adenine2030-N6)-methyltransferase